MPELPEVETLARNLHRLVLGAEFSGVEFLWSGAVAVPSPEELAHQLPGHTILDVGRRGKFLMLSLSGPSCLLIHLRMSGQVRVLDRVALADRHARVVFHLTDGRRMVFSDTRKFGRVYWVDDPALVVRDLGPEPLAADMTPQKLAALLCGRRGALKPLLLNQRVIAGLGNIYADEVLFAARLHPLRRANTLSQEEIGRLHVALGQVLHQAIGNRGTTLRDARFRDAEGQQGLNGESLSAYHHTGEPCPRCGTPIERAIVGGRGTHFCPCCQRQEVSPRCCPVGAGWSTYPVEAGWTPSTAAYGAEYP